MAFQTVFERYELKYLLTPEQQEKVLQKIRLHITPDRYGCSTIRNLYFDTSDYRLIRHSMEKPVYKEKLRIRSYSRTTPGSTVFAELKKKYRSVVYKRRILLPENEAVAWLSGKIPCPKDTQISREIDYVLNFYRDLHPTVFLSYQREAFFSREDPNFRVTFDRSVLCRQSDLSLGTEVYGAPLLPDGKVLMEVKCSGGMPLFMARVLCEEGLCKTPFSKYGTAYETIIFPNLKKEIFCHA